MGKYKYIRTKDKILEVVYPSEDKNGPIYAITNIFRQRAYLEEFDNLPHDDTIEELCDVYLMVLKECKFPQLVGKMNYEYCKTQCKWESCYAAIWTYDSNGAPTLKPVAKMNEKGELELL